MGRAESSTAETSSDDDSDLHTIIFSGLGLDESVDPGVETLTAKAHFWIHSMHSVTKEAGTFQVRGFPKGLALFYGDMVFNSPYG